MAIEVIMPKMEMAQETATIVEWLKREGESVEKGEPLFVIETDKVTVEVEAPASGILSGVRAEVGQEVPVTKVIAYLLQPGEELPQKVEEKVEPAAKAEISTGSTMAATPDARRMAATHEIDLSTITGSGPGGQIITADVEKALAAASSSASEVSMKKVRATPSARRVARERGVDISAVKGSGPRGKIQASDVLAFSSTSEVSPASPGEIIPIQGIRRTIADRMMLSHKSIPPFAITVRVNMSHLEETRARLNTEAEEKGLPRISVTACILKAAARELIRHPWINSTFTDEGIHLLPDINIGVAVGRDEGLIGPVVHQADQKSIAEIAFELKDLVTRTQDSQLTPADVAGGTFTISNLGPFGIEQFTAIINYPQAAILAMGAILPEVVQNEAGQIVVSPIARLTLSADHRIIDGVKAARFLADLRDRLEEFSFLSSI
jgi:pyruvate dehydrogenase E2 component (dihydrolipoamide acetyltransferase)